MKKSEDNPYMKVLKTATCKTLSGKSTLTYQLGCLPDSTIHLRITKNSGGGFFSDEWIAIDDIQAVLKERSKDSPIMSHFISPLLQGKSSNICHGGPPVHRNRPPDKSPVQGMLHCLAETLRVPEKDPGHHEMEGAAEITLLVLSDPLPDRVGGMCTAIYRC